MDKYWWRRHWQRLAAAAIWSSLIGGLAVALRTNNLSLADLFLAGMVWVSTSPLAPLSYIAIYAVRPLTLFSSVLLTLAGGLLFGPLWGVACISSLATRSPRTNRRHRNASWTSLSAH